MKSPFRFVLAGAALLAAASPLTASAQNRQPAASRQATPAASAALPHKVGLVDVGYIFTNYEKLKASREAFAKEVEAAAAGLKPIQEQIETIQNELKSGTIAKGTDGWTEREQKIIELNAKGQLASRDLRVELARREAEMYKEIYDEVAYTVAQYAAARNYTLVLRYQRETPEEANGTEDPSKMMSRVNQLVVYHQATDDMTETILEYMNAQYEKTAARPAAPARN